MATTALGMVLVDLGRLEDRKTLLEAFDRARREADLSAAMAGLDAFQARAFEIITSGAVRAALDVSRTAAWTEMSWWWRGASSDARHG